MTGIPYPTQNCTNKVADVKFRIALIGLNVLEEDSPDLKAALRRRLSVQQDWKVVFMADANYESLRFLRRIRCEGVLARIVDQKMAKEALKLSCPLVNISSLLPVFGISTVRRDYRAIGQMCVRHLLERGFERFAIVQDSAGVWASQISQAGILRELEDHGKHQQVANFTLDIDQAERTNYQELRQWLRSLQRPFALMVIGDEFAGRMMKCCHQEGLRIPHEVGVITTASHTNFLRECSPAVTHPVPDGDWIVQPACDYLDDLMKGRQSSGQCFEIACPGLVVCDSTNTLAVEDPLVRKGLEFIEASFRSPIHVGHVVRHVGAARRMVERRFRVCLGKTILTYLTEKRIDLAKELLQKNPDQKLTELAREVGFKSAQAFRTSFYRLTGQVPSYWRDLGKTGLSQNRLQYTQNERHRSATMRVRSG